MEQRTPPEFILEAFADPNSVHDVVKGILHTIFFHRWFPAVVPSTREVLDLTLPHVEDVELETLIEQRTTTLLRQLEASNTDQASHQQHHTSSPKPHSPQQQHHQYTSAFSARGVGAPGGGPGGGSGGGGGNQPPAGGRGHLTVQFFEKKRRKAWIMARADEEVCWESWTVRVTVAEPRTESERAKVRRATEQTLHATVMKIVSHANVHKDHIPPITAQGTNPFPYQINVNQKESAGWATRMGIY